ncbi:MAG TPA: hypothetical protein VK453_00355 [Micromonosporaceae bacterium]|nr:hypothetical protein [Micromonosporaceae bacterium]
MPPPYTDATALELARALAPIWGLREEHLPTTVFAGVLNGLAECQAVLDAMPQAETPAPITQLVPEWLP